MRAAAGGGALRAAAGEVTTTVVGGSYLIVKIGSDWILRSRGEIFLIEFTLFNTFKLLLCLPADHSYASDQLLLFQEY